MPSPQFSSYNFTATPAVLVNAVEAVAITTKPVSSPYSGCAFSISFSFFVGLGAGATGVTIAVRRASLTGTIVLAGQTYAAVASVNNGYSVAIVDAPAGESSGLTWVLTLTIIGGAAGGNSVNNYSNVIAAQ